MGPCLGAVLGAEHITGGHESKAACAQGEGGAWRAECDLIRHAREAAAAPKAAAGERYDTARTQQAADAAQADARAATAELKRALATPEPPPPQPLTMEQEQERHMAEPMFFQARADRQACCEIGSQEHAHLLLPGTTVLVTPR